MIDPSEPIESQVEKQAKIIDALIRRATREGDMGNKAYSLFQSAITLQGEVWEKTRDLERALDTLGRTNNDLAIAQSAREKSQKNLALALDSMEGGFALFTKGKLEVFNDRFKALIPDVSRIILPGLEFSAYLLAVKKSKFVSFGSENQQKAEAGSNHDDEPVNISNGPIVFRLPNDRWFQITSKNTNVNNLVVVQSEITSIVRKNRMEKDRLIDKHSHFLQAAFDHMHQGLCTFSEEGSLLIGNERFAELLELPQSLMTKGTAFAQIFDYVKKNNLLLTPDTYWSLDYWNEYLRKNKAIQQSSRHANGAMLDIGVHKLPDNGFMIEIHDVTEETQAKELLEQRVRERTLELTNANERLRVQHAAQAKVEEDLRIANDEAKAAISSKTRFFAAASHDLLQPVNAAKLLISILKEKMQDSPIEDMVDRLDTSFHSVETLLHAVLDISRLEATGTEMSVSSFDIGDLLQMVQADCLPLAANKNISLDIVPSTLWVKSDRRYLLRSIQNLVVNAIQYTEQGRVLVGCRRRGDEVIVQVWDTGIGIKEADIGDIFNEFSRVNSSNRTEGMGLGLSIVERACRNLGHPVRVKSKPGVGSMFSITLPMAEPAIVSSNHMMGKKVSNDADMELIVAIIENDDEVLFATTQTLENWGGSVVAAKSTKQLLQMIEEIGMAPDIILADYQLDDDDNGLKAIQTLREGMKTEIPAIMITANREEELHDASKEYDFSILTKPVQASRLRSLIDWKTRHQDAVE